jgi:CubicO group peptidase (beta-lactamase class C family)
MNNINTSQIDKTVLALMKACGAPGCAIAVISGDDVYMQGYGVKELGKPDKVTADTLFANASTTKAVTTAAMARLVGEGKMAWDDPVRKYVPHFRLTDPHADSLVTLRDLVCHRTGLPRHDMLWYHSAYTREDIVRRIGYAKPSAPFRMTYQYQNICFTVAGEAIRVASGAESFEAYTRENLLVPLGMARANFTSREAQADPDHATPHIKKKGKVTPNPWLNFDALGPAGTMNSSVSEMVHWLKFQLAGGMASGETRLVQEAALRETHKPHIPTPTDDDARARYPFVVQTSYALGWGVSNWRGGERMLSHGGAIDGFRSQATLIPERNIALVVFVNLSSAFSESCRNALLDILLGYPSGEWEAVLRADVAKAAKNEKEAEAKRRETRKKGLPSPLPLTAFVGDYECPAYGLAKVTLTDSKKLQLAWNAFDVPLRHQTFSSFITDTEVDAFQNVDVKFRISPKGEVEALELFDGVLVRRPA